MLSQEELDCEYIFSDEEAQANQDITSPEPRRSGIRGASFLYSPSPGIAHSSLFHQNEEGGATLHPGSLDVLLRCNRTPQLPAADQSWTSSLATPCAFSVCPSEMNTEERKVFLPSEGVQLTTAQEDTPLDDYARSSGSENSVSRLHSSSSRLSKRLFSPRSSLGSNVASPKVLDSPYLPNTVPVSPAFLSLPDTLQVSSHSSELGLNSPLPPYLEDTVPVSPAVDPFTDCPDQVLKSFNEVEVLNNIDNNLSFISVLNGPKSPIIGKRKSKCKNCNNKSNSSSFLSESLTVDKQNCEEVSRLQDYACPLSPDNVPDGDVTLDLYRPKSPVLTRSKAVKRKRKSRRLKHRPVRQKSSASTVVADFSTSNRSEETINNDHTLVPVVDFSVSKLSGETIENENTEVIADEFSTSKPSGETTRNDDSRVPTEDLSTSKINQQTTRNDDTEVTDSSMSKKSRQTIRNENEAVSDAKFSKSQINRHNIKNKNSTGDLSTSKPSGATPKVLDALDRQDLMYEELESDVAEIMRSMYDVKETEPTTSKSEFTTPSNQVKKCSTKKSESKSDNETPKSSNSNSDNSFNGYSMTEIDQAIEEAKTSKRSISPSPVKSHRKKICFAKDIKTNVNIKSEKVGIENIVQTIKKQAAKNHILYPDAPSRSSSPKLTLDDLQKSALILEKAKISDKNKKTSSNLPRNQNQPVQFSQMAEETEEQSAEDVEMLIHLLDADEALFGHEEPSTSTTTPTIKPSIDSEVATTTPTLNTKESELDLSPIKKLSVTSTPTIKPSIDTEVATTTPTLNPKDSELHLSPIKKLSVTSTPTVKPSIDSEVATTTPTLNPKDSELDLSPIKKLSVISTPNVKPSVHKVSKMTTSTPCVKPRVHKNSSEPNLSPIKSINKPDARELETGFSSVSGKKLKVSRLAVMRAQKVLSTIDEDTSLPSTSLNVKGNSSSAVNTPVRDNLELPDINETPIIKESSMNFQGFATASGKKLKLSEKALYKAKQLFSEEILPIIPECDDVILPPLEPKQLFGNQAPAKVDFVRFSTATGKTIKPSESAIARAKKVFGESILELQNSTENEPVSLYVENSFNDDESLIKLADMCTTINEEEKLKPPSTSNSVNEDLTLLQLADSLLKSEPKNITSKKLEEEMCSIDEDLMQQVAQLEESAINNMTTRHESEIVQSDELIKNEAYKKAEEIFNNDLKIFSLNRKVQSSDASEKQVEEKSSFVMEQVMNKENEIEGNAIRKLFIKDEKYEVTSQPAEDLKPNNVPSSNTTITKQDVLECTPQENSEQSTKNEPILSDELEYPERIFAEDTLSDPQTFQGFVSASGKKLSVSEQALHDAQVLFKNLEDVTEKTTYCSPEHHAESSNGGETKSQTERQNSFNDSDMDHLLADFCENNEESSIKLQLVAPQGKKIEKMEAAVEEKSEKSTKRQFDQVNTTSNIKKRSADFKEEDNYLKIASPQLKKIKSEIVDISSEKLITSVDDNKYSTGPEIAKSLCGSQEYKTECEDVGEQVDTGGQLSAANFKGFSTASGKKVTISDKAIKAAREIFKDTIVENENIPETNSEPNLSVFQGFATASGKKVAISEESIQAAKKRFADPENDDTLSNQKAPKLPMFQGFATASGKKVAISEESIQAARKKLADLENDDTLSNEEAPKPPMFQGFATASGKKVAISEESIQAAKKKFAETDIDLLVKQVAAPKPPMFQGFATAGGKKVAISEKSIQAAKKRFADTDNELILEQVEAPEPTMFQGFATAGGKKVAISEESIQAARKRLADLENDDTLSNEEAPEPTMFQGFATAGGKKVAISEESIQAAKKRFAETESDNVENSKARQSKPQGFAAVSGKTAVESDEAISAHKFAEVEVRTTRSASNLKAAKKVMKDVDHNSSLSSRSAETSVQISQSESETQASCSESSQSQTPKSPILNRKTKLLPLKKRRQLQEAREKQSRDIKDKSKMKVGQVAGKILQIRRSGVTLHKLKNLAQEDQERPRLLDVTSTSAQGYKFKLGDITTCDDGAVIIPGNYGEVGTEEIESAFLASPGVDPALIPPGGWVRNHCRWIIWKLAATERRFPEQCSNYLSLNNVMMQLKFRYDREIDLAQTPAIRRITEQDSAPSARIVLCVAEINLSFNSEYLILTDSWYLIKTKVDEEMIRLLHSKKVVEGTKLVIHGAEFTGKFEACHPLQQPPDLSLKISTNSTRTARWDAMLGFCRNQGPIKVALSSVLPYGGLVGEMWCSVARVYPLLFAEHQEQEGVSKTTTIRGERAEKVLAEKFEVQRQRTVERIMAEETTRVTREKEAELAQRRRSCTSVDFEDGATICMALEDDPDLHSSLTESQLDLASEWGREDCERWSRVLEDRARGRMSVECPSRSVSPLLRVRLVTVGETEPSALLSIWRPDPELMKIFNKQNAVVTIYNCNASGRRGGELCLNSTKQTKIVEACPMELDDSLIRKVTPICSLDDSNFKPIFNEIDLVGVVSKVEPAQNNNSQLVTLCDAMGYQVVICFWGGIEAHGLTQLLIPGVSISATNLQFRKGAKRNFPNNLASLPCLHATESSQFSRQPNEAYLKEALQNLRATLDPEMTIKSLKRCLTPKPVIEKVVEKTPCKEVQKRMSALSRYGEPPPLSPFPTPQPPRVLFQTFRPPTKMEEADSPPLSLSQ